MGLWERWRVWRNGRQFVRKGPGCQFSSGRIEVKGHVALGQGCVIRGNVVLRTHKGGKIFVGDGVELGDYVLIQSNGEIEIGCCTYVAPHCVIRDTNHLFHGTDVHWRLTPHIVKPIVIGPKCYLGARTYVMPGVTIGEGAVVAPGSVVTKDIPSCEIWAGSPARFVVHRTDPAKRSALKRNLSLVSLFGVAQAGPKEGEQG